MVKNYVQSWHVGEGYMIIYNRWMVQMMGIIKGIRNYLVGILLIRDYSEVFGAWKRRNDLGQTKTWVRNIRKLMSKRQSVVRLKEDFSNG